MTFLVLCLLHVIPLRSIPNTIRFVVTMLVGMGTTADESFRIASAIEPANERYETAFNHTR